MGENVHTEPGLVITRKTFLRGLLAGSASILAFRVGLGAGGALAADAPVKGGVFNFNLTADPPNFDPLSATSSIVMLIIGPCYNGLVRYDPQSPEAIIPDLATSWEISPDGLVYTFPLVKNATFHDGKPMTSADAVHTFETIRNPPDGVVSARKKLMTHVESIEAPDDYTIVFKLSRPSPSFLANLASCWMLVLPKHVLEEKGNLKDVVVGTGPFRLAGFTRGVSYELERNPDYHVPDRPYLDSLVGYVIPDSGTTWNYLQNGQLQLFYSIQGQDAGAFQSGPGVVVQEAPSTSFIGIVFNANAAPFDNKLVRQALSIGTSRSAALAVTYNGKGELGGISVPGKWALPGERLAEVPGYGPNGEADVEKAKAMLAEAGYPDGFDVNLLVRQNPLFEPVGVFLKDQWAKLGVRATIDIQEGAAYAEAVAAGNFQVSASGGSYAITDPDSVFGDESICGGRKSAVCSARMLSLYDQQSTEMDEARRLEIVHELELETLREYGVYVMYWRNRFMGMSDTVRGLQVHPNIDQNMRREDVWLDG